MRNVTNRIIIGYTMHLNSKWTFLASVALCCAMGLSACSYPVKPAARAPVQDRPPPPAAESDGPAARPGPVYKSVSPPAPPPHRTRPAVARLSEEAASHQRRGQLDTAAALLERALRIDGRDAATWHKLARVRFAQKRYGPAINMAEKSNSVAGGDRGLRAENWRLIAKARRKSGDLAGAARAEAKAVALSRGR